MSKTFPNLTRPGQIGTLQLKNRMLVTAMGVSLAESDGTCGDRIIDFHERHARGGVGLIILGVAGVSWPAGGNQIGQIAISEDRHIPGLKRLADAVHKHGAKLATQLHHGGLTSPEDMKAGRPVWVPSYPAPINSDMGNSILMSEAKAFKKSDSPQLHVMSEADIATLVEQFAAAAGRAKQAGIDAIEIHGGHGYIISGFLSPALNQRDDKYGGSLENRARLLLEIIAAVRARVGKDYPVWVKLDSEEFGRPEGITPADAQQTAILAEAAGADAINASAFHDVSRGALHSESNIPHVPGRLVANAASIKKVVSIPVITSGRLEPEIANKHIGDGKFDFLGMGRKLLADPDLPNKIIAGNPEDVRPCVYCYCCVSQIYLSKPVKCAVNPETAHERARALVPLEQAENKPRHIGVVGGGPGGMEVAHRLASRGFRVSLLESSGRLGGTLQFAGLAYPPNEKLMNWLRRKIKNSEVEVHLNTLATPERLKELAVDEVVVATGAQRGMPEGIAGSDQNFVFSGEEMRALVLAESHPELARKTSSLTRLLAATGAKLGITSVPEIVRQISKVWMPLGKRITIVGAELVGLELAEYLAERGRVVTVIDDAPQAGKGLYLVRRMRLLDELNHLGVTMILGAEGINIGDQNINYTNARGQQRRLNVDHVIVAKGAIGDSTLADQLTDSGFKTHTIGDCNGVSYIEGALESAAVLATKIT